MAGTAMSELIFFITAIVVSSAVALALIGIVDEYAQSLEDEASLIRAESNSHLSFINDPKNVPYQRSTGNLTYYLKNTGTGDLSTSDIVVSANGTAKAGSSISVRLVGGGARWGPGATAEVRFAVSGLRKDVDYPGWASTSGTAGSSAPRGSAQDTIVFRITEV